MLFVTNRRPLKTDDNSFKFDLTDNSPSNSVYFCDKRASGKRFEIGSVDFLDRLKTSKAKQILFMVHGFANMPNEDIFPRADELQDLFNEYEQDLVEVVPIIWPCDNDLGLVKDYWDDQKAADLSGVSFARMLQKFLEWQPPQKSHCMKRINVLAHSMGNRVLRETLRNWSRYDLPNGLPLIFRNTFLVAADLVNESLEKGKSGEHICRASRNVCVYYASDDLALRASKVSNLKNNIASRRLGHTGPEDMSRVLNNVYAVDCDNFNNSYDKPVGHAYFLRDDHGKPGKVFTHMAETIKRGRVASSCKESIL